ncbi:MAG TPA: M48 family metallopeptidase, partial [Bacteroidales bacterium]|nr:M48 family metallopeptidase [Bacteroidales bacterium]
MTTIFLYLILAFIAFNFLVDRILEHLNSSRLTNILPSELAGIYDPEKYRKSQDYARTKNKLSSLQSTFSFFILMMVLIFGGFVWLDISIREFTANPYLLALLFFAVIAMVSGVLSLPFELYHTFVIEEKFGFNLTTVRTFILDKIKGILLGALLGGGILLLIILIYEKTGNYFWLIAWAVLSFFSIFMSMFYSDLIVPLFNKQKPLEPGELRDAIQNFASKVGFKLKNIYVIDGSKRSRKSNAYFTGLGAKKRIVLYDTLIQDHTTEELVAVLAH